MGGRVRYKVVKNDQGAWWGKEVVDYCITILGQNVEFTQE